MLNMATKQFTTGQLIARSLTPSASSGFLCVIIGIALELIHIVLLSVSLGTALPGVLDGQWAVAYTENVVQPLSTFFTNNIFNKLIVASLWGAVGLAVYMGFEYGIHNYRMVQEAKRQVALNANGSWDRGPMQRYFVRAMLWRVGVLVMAFVFLAAMQPLFKYAIDTGPQVLVSRDLASDGLRVAAGALVWALFCHGIVVLLRLYMQRTRLFGDEALY